MEKSILTMVIVLLTISNILGQDLIYTVSGEINGNKTSLDSILVENLTNKTRILFGDLPEHDYYQINLSKNALGTDGINDIFEDAPVFTVSKNIPGRISINYQKRESTEIKVSVFNIMGQKVYGSTRQLLHAKNAVDITLNHSGMYFVRVEGPSFTQIFKALGAENDGGYAVEITGHMSSGVTVKSGAFVYDTDFSFTPGDSIQISIYKNEYFAQPVELKISEPENVDITFYKTVIINGKEWMAENLADPTSSGSWAYNNDENTVATYGRLYTLEAAKAACPSGWHLPTDDEWKHLEMAIGMSQSEADEPGYRRTNEGTKLKTTSGWDSNGNGTDDYGFSGLPSGYRHPDGNFYFNGNYSLWWSSTKSSWGAWGRVLSYGSTKFGRNIYNMNHGFSVRYVKDQQLAPAVTTNSATNINATSSTLYGNVTSAGSATITSRGFYWSATNQTPDLNDNKETVSGTTGPFNKNITGLTLNTRYYYRAFATNSAGTTAGAVQSFIKGEEQEDGPGTFTDNRDNKTYKTAIINDTEWMAENLAYNTSGGSWAYNNDESMVATYGRLYTWETANAACPTGWRLPTDDEWKQMEMAIGMSQSEADGTAYRGTDEGTKLKAISGWDSNGNGTDDYGFSALPGGYRHTDGSFYFEGNYGLWWSATESNSYYAWGRVLSYGSPKLGRNSYDKVHRFSVRCVRDYNPPIAPSVTTNAAYTISETSIDLNGNVTSDGNSAITDRGFYWSATNPTPDSNDNIETVSGTTGTFNKTITGLTLDTRYYYRAFAANGEGTSMGEVKDFKLHTDCIVITPLTDENIHSAVDLWLSDQASAEATYGHISNWCTSNITDMSYLFENARSFNEDIGNWDVSSVTDMSYMFWYAWAFNQDIGNWNVSYVTDMGRMFEEAKAFNQDISAWDVSNVNNMGYMFYEAESFNENINTWDVSNVSDMSSMFFRAYLFNQNIGNWDVSNVSDMSSMFFIAQSFNQDISTWDVSNVSDMRSMFYMARSFDQDLSNWDVSNVTIMSSMFSGATLFNQDISGWDVSHVTTMFVMFSDANAFNQDISAWDVGSVTNMVAMFFNATSFSTENYDNLLTGWATQTLQQNVEFDVPSTSYCNAETARASIISNYGWRITDAGKYCAP